MAPAGLGPGDGNAKGCQDRSFCHDLPAPGGMFDLQPSIPTG